MKVFKTLANMLSPINNVKEIEMGKAKLAQQARMKKLKEQKEKVTKPKPPEGTLKDEFIHELTTNKHNLQYFVVFVLVDGQREMIIFNKVDKESKAQYYLGAYDDDMKLKANPNIRIAKWGWTAGVTKINAGFCMMSKFTLDDMVKG